MLFRLSSASYFLFSAREPDFAKRYHSFTRHIELKLDCTLMRIPFTNTRLPLGWLVEPFTSIVPNKAIVPILQGPGRGIRWVVGSGMPNFWLGTYEKEKYQLFSRELSPGMVVYDIGANVGVYTVLACSAVGEKGRVFSFEPATMNLFYLNENVRVNRFLNCEVIPKAVSDSDGTVQFEFSGESCLGKISTDGLLRVPSISLDSFCFTGKPAPQLLKIDVEGAEYEVLTGAAKVLLEAKPVIFLATHGNKIHSQCCELLQKLGYRIQALASDEIIARFSANNG
jgi:FkbM family methyltransferase